MPVEAMAAGTPVIGSSIGGVSETVLHGKTGALLEEFTTDSLLDAVRIIDSLDRKIIPSRALEFSSNKFDKNIESWVLRS